MEETKTDGAQKEIVVEEKKAEFVSVSDLKALLEENNKKWQSKFDTVLTEKKAVEGKALTTEQRIEMIEKERLEERLSWSRKEAKAKAQIDDELETAILAYTSNDITKIQEGASQLRSTIDKLMASKDSKIQELEQTILELKGSQPKPKGGSDVSKGFDNMTQDEVMQYARKGEVQKAEVMAYLKQPKKG